MRGGGIIARITALLDRLRNPIEDARDERTHGDWPFIPAQLAPLASADELGGVRTESIGCAALCSEAVEQDGWITVIPVHAAPNRTGGQQDHVQ